jgi:hypothetical protein
MNANRTLISIEFAVISVLSAFISGSSISCVKNMRAARAYCQRLFYGGGKRSSHQAHAWRTGPAVPCNLAGSRPRRAGGRCGLKMVWLGGARCVAQVEIRWVVKSRN